MSAIPAPPEPKRPINRKLAYLVLMGLGLLGVFAVIAVLVNDPRKAQENRDAEADRQALERLPTGSTEAAAAQLDEASRRADAEARRREEDEQRRREGFDAFVGGGQRAPSRPNAINPELLEELDRAHREAGMFGNPARQEAGLPPVGSLPNDGSSRGLLEQNAVGIVHDNYGAGARAGAGAKGRTLVEEAADTFFGEGASDDLPSSARRSVGGGAVYEGIRPAAPPSVRVLNEGTGIPAVLMTRIDTRRAGPVSAMVNRPVYDSRTSRTVLIPEGSRLVGSYTSEVSAGDDRLDIAFTRLVMPDGRAFNLPQFPASGGDGTIGIKGKYRSNIGRAIGPSFVVALTGQALDRYTRKEIPVSESGASAGYPMQQSPSVLEQTMPKINEAVLRRYEGARPYITIQPGVVLRVVLTADLEVPASKGGKS